MSEKFLIGGVHLSEVRHISKKYLVEYLGQPQFACNLKPENREEGWWDGC